MTTEKINNLAEKHARIVLGEKQFKNNKNAIESITNDFKAGYEAAEDVLFFGSNTGLGKIVLERKEHFTKHNKSIGNDWAINYDQQLSKAAAILVQFEIPQDQKPPEKWDSDQFRKMCNKTYEERVIIAGALLAGELDRLSFTKYLDEHFKGICERSGPLRIFKIDDGETTFVCHFGKEAAINLYTKEIGSDESDIEKVEEVPSHEWPDMKISDTEAELNDDGEYPVLETFQQYMCTAIRPDIICSSLF